MIGGRPRGASRPAESPPVQRPRALLHGLLALTLGLVALEILTLPWLRAQLLAAPLAGRIAATVALQCPLGLVLGAYFPTGLELLRRREPRLVPWAWAVNGVASVAASVLAVMLGMALGCTDVALIAAGRLRARHALTHRNAARGRSERRILSTPSSAWALASSLEGRTRAGASDSRKSGRKIPF
jgi:hypothetical protein